MTFTYSVDSTDEEAWHEARAHTEDGQIVVTASEIAMLANGGTSVWANLRAEKAGAKSRWTGNEYTVWGHAREPDIAASVTALYPHLVHNTRLVINDEQPWLRGTPDMIGTDNAATLCQIKTALWRGEKWDSAHVPKSYVDQMQAEMLVTGATVNLLAVEFYDELDTGGFVPHFLFEDPHIIAIERDDERIAELVAIAEQFQSMGEPDTLDIFLADYARADATGEGGEGREGRIPEAHREGDRGTTQREVRRRPRQRHPGQGQDRDRDRVRRGAVQGEGTQDVGEVRRPKRKRPRRGDSPSPPRRKEKQHEQRNDTAHGVNARSASGSAVLDRPADGGTTAARSRHELAGRPRGVLPPGTEVGTGPVQARNLHDNAKR